MSELQAEPAGFFHGAPFLLERITDKLCLFRLGYLADIFSKMNRERLSLQGKQLTAFVANDKFNLSSKN